MQFTRISGITVTCSLAAVLSTNHIEQNKATKPVFETKNSPTFPLFLPEHADVCLSLEGGPKVCSLFFDLARFTIVSADPDSREFFFLFARKCSGA